MIELTKTEFVRDYFMHDSLIDGIEILNDGKRIIIMIDFAFWMQDGYKESDPETGQIKVTFQDVTFYDIPNDVNWYGTCILEMRMDDERIKFIIMNDMTDDYLEIYIDCASVMW